MASLLLTVELMAVSVAIAAIVGVVGAWAAWTVSQAGSIGRLVAGLFFAAMIVSVSLPMILHAAAWEATAGKFGWLSLTQTGSRGYGGLGGVFGGLIACGWIHGLFGSGLVALATWFGVRRTPAAVIEQSQLDFGPLRGWWQVRLPIAAPWTVTALLATAALAATEMTVVDLYGFRTIADEFYLQFAVDPTVSAVAWACGLPLLFASAILSVLFSRWSSARAIQFSVDDPLRHPNAIVEPAGRLASALAAVIAIVVAGLVAIVPISGLVIKAGHEVVVDGASRSVSWSLSRCVENVASAPKSFAAEYQWTIQIAIFTAVVAVLLGWCAAALGRENRKYECFFDGLSIGLVLIPGPIVGLLVVRLFQLDIPGVRVMYHQTLVPTIVALLFRSCPAAYWMMRAGYRGVGANVLNTARMESSWIRRMWAIDRPLLMRSLMGAILVSAIVASGDVPALLPVIPPGVTTVGTRLFEQLHSGARYQEASLALWYVGSITILSIVWFVVGARWRASSHVRME